MKYLIATPSFPLSKFVKHYWSIENCFPNGHVHTQRIVPNGLLELMFYMGDLPLSGTQSKAISHHSVITGQLNEFYDLKVSGNLSLFSVLFKPHGLSMFLDIPLNELQNRNIPLRFLYRQEAKDLESKLFEESSFSGRIKIIEVYLLNLLQKRKRNYHFDRIENIISMIDRSRGKIDIPGLASGSCYSRKQFERLFSRNIGSSPKQFLKTVRFQNTIDVMAKEKSVNLTELCYYSGYYDQSHMIGEFRKLTGLTPKQYYQECEPYSDYFL